MLARQKEEAVSVQQGQTIKSRKGETVKGLGIRKK